MTPEPTLTAAQLAALPYFADLDAPTRQLIARHAVFRAYEPGQVVCLEGEPSTGLWLVTAGWLKAIKLSPDGREHILALLSPGDVFNAIGVFASSANPATVMALEPAQVWAFPRGLMRDLLAQQPALAYAVIEDFASRVLHLITMVEDLSLRTVEARLARLLLEHTESDTLPRQRWATQAEMAARLGTVPDVVNRALRALSREGLIRVQRQRIEILNRGGLRNKTRSVF